MLMFYSADIECQNPHSSTHLFLGTTLILADILGQTSIGHYISQAYLVCSCLLCYVRSAMVCFLIVLIGLQWDGFLFVGIGSFDSSNLDVRNIQIGPECFRCFEENNSSTL